MGENRNKPEIFKLMAYNTQNRIRVFGQVMFRETSMKRWGKESERDHLKTQ